MALLASPVLAGSPASPEIEDERGDVDVQHLVDADVLSEADVEPEELETSADVARAWVDSETEDSFAVHVELADVPDDRNVSSPLVEVWTHFTVRDGRYHVAATLASPTEGVVEANYDLYLDDAKVGSLAGDVDPGSDVVTFRVPKADVRDPGQGDELTDFHVTTHVPESQAALDYAPGANEENLPSTSEAERTDPTELQLAADPLFGDSYAFQDLGATESRIAVDVTPDSLEVEAGSQARFAVPVVNDADQAEEVSATVSNTPPGWSARLDPGSMTVSAHGSQTATLYVTPAHDAEGHQLIDVQVVGQRGADMGASVSVIAVQPDGGGGSGSWSGDGASAGADGSSSSSDDGSSDGTASAGDGAAKASADEANESAGEEASSIPVLWPIASIAAVALVALLARIPR